MLVVPHRLRATWQARLTIGLQPPDMARSASQAIGVLAARQRMDAVDPLAALDIGDDAAADHRHAGTWHRP